MPDLDTGHEPESSNFDIRQASSLRGPEARKWFARQLMLPEWMIDVPDNLSRDWYVLARPAGKRCFVVSADGTTVSRLRNGSVLHHFPSALPGGARKKGTSGPAQSYSILDSIFHEACTLSYWKYSLVLIWEDGRCSQYVIDTDNNGQVPNQQHIVLELQDDGKIVTSDDPPVPVNCLNADFVKQSGLSSGSLLRFAIGDGGLNCVGGKFEKADLQYISESNRARAFADSYSKIGTLFLSILHSKFWGII